MRGWPNDATLGAGYTTSEFWFQIEGMNDRMRLPCYFGSQSLEMLVSLGDGSR
jgi:hypothetical protein